MIHVVIPRINTLERRNSQYHKNNVNKHSQNSQQQSHKHVDKNISKQIQFTFKTIVSTNTDYYAQQFQQIVTLLPHISKYIHIYA